MNLTFDQDRIKEFCQRWGVEELSVFGSALRDDFGPESDVDVLVSLSPSRSVDIDDWLQMMDELKEIFGRDIDLLDKGSLRNPFRRRSILTSKKVLYGT